MDRHYFNHTPNTIYTNKGGGSYICLEAEGPSAKPEVNFRVKWARASCGSSRLSDVRGRQKEWDSPKADTSRNNTAQVGLEVPLVA